jgi:hypothetical protein
MMRRRQLAALALLPLTSQASDAVEEIGRRLQGGALQRGRFEQEKQLAGFAKPLKSQGDYLLLRGKGLIWRTAAPFASQLVLTRDSIAGSDGLRLDASREPGVRLVTGLMLALLDGDLRSLAAHFELQAELLAGQAWRASLRPKAAALAKLFSAIEIDGDRQPRRILLREAQGDRTLIRFDEQQRQPAAPNADEVKLLG